MSYHQTENYSKSIRGLELEHVHFQGCWFLKKFYVKRVLKSLSVSN